MKPNKMVKILNVTKLDHSPVPPSAAAHRSNPPPSAAILKSCIGNPKPESQNSFFVSQSRRSTYPPNSCIAFIVPHAVNVVHVERDQICQYNLSICRKGPLHYRLVLLLSSGCQTHFLNFKIEEKKVIVEKLGKPAESYDDFTACLPDEECRYVVFGFEFMTRRKMRSFISYASKLLISRIPSRSMSQSTSIPKKQARVRDHGYDNYMEIDKKVRKVLKFQELILSQPNNMISVSRLDSLSRRIGFKQFESGRFILKFPHVFEVFEHPVQRILYCRLARKAVAQIEQENDALLRQIPDAVMRLRKLLMLSNTGRIRLEHVRIARKEFGLPDDFEYSVILKHPRFFRLFDADETRNKYIEMVEKDSSLGVCEIERVREREYRQKGIDAEDIRFSFIVNFPPGFKIGKYYKIAVWKWQRVPYWSPYENISGYDLRSLEAQKRMEKRAVAMIHELLSLSVEKKMTLERIAHFRMAMDLPKKLKEFLLQHQGIFYISTRGNHGKLHTVFLREAYKKGELIEPNELYLARRKLAQLVLVSPRKAKLDEELTYYRRDALEDDGRNVERGYIEDDLDVRENGERDESGGDPDLSDASVYSDDESDGSEVNGVESCATDR